MRKTAQVFKISRGAARIGLLSYAYNTNRLFGMSGSYTLGQIYNSVNGIRRLNGRRRLGSALNYAKQYLFSGKPQCGRRRVLIVLTFGTSFDQVRRPAVALQAAGVEIFMVGVGRVNSRTLLQVATDRQHIFMVGFARLYTIVTTLRDKICYSPGELSMFLQVDSFFQDRRPGETTVCQKVAPLNSMHPF